jgi:hypothetical protein
MDEATALRVAKNAYDSSTTYLDANYRKQWESNLKMFQSKHPSDSKYHSDAYKYRSKVFRPKTRSAIRRLEAATAAAFFSNVDVVNVEATNDKNQRAVESAKVRKALLQYRLTKTIPWFVTVVGAVQDAGTIGVVCSYQYWEYREKRTKRKEIALAPDGVALVDTDGKEVLNDVEDVEVIQDRPCVHLLPAENLRISSGAAWYDPINTSPYVIELVPMFVCDVMDMMDTIDPKTGQPAWKKLTMPEIQACRSQNYDSTRQAREGNRQDSKQPSEALTEFDIVWVHRNIVRWKGEDHFYYTMGTEHVLTPPRKLKEVYFHGRRPYVMGVAQIEAHKVYPPSPAELGEQVQREINEVANQRLDNVKLVLNKRYITKRGAQVDTKSLVRNVPASVTFANDPDKDIRTLEWNDVTGSSYQEGDRLNVEYDELVGNFSQSSVMTNRKLNETVGGMAMMNQGASQMSEYTIRTLTETWVEPVLNQLSELEAEYETDETILALAGTKAGIENPEGADYQGMMSEDLTLTVSVGMGATDPMMRLNKLLAGVQAMVQLFANPVQGLNIGEVGKEIWGALGYRDGGRFFSDEEDPRVAMLAQQLQQMAGQLQQLQVQLKDKQGKIEVDAARVRLDAAGQEMQDRETIAKIDFIQAQTLEALAKAGIPADAALKALGTSPTLQ